jgi:hypothetical protein
MERGLAIERAFSVERALAMERAFSVVAFQFYQRLRLRKLRHPTPPPVHMCPRQQMVQSKIRLSGARRHRRVRVQASPWLVAMASPQQQQEWLRPLPPLLRQPHRARPLLRFAVAILFGCGQEGH